MSEAFWVGGVDSVFSDEPNNSGTEIKKHEVDLVRLFEKRYEILPGNVGLYHWISSREKDYSMEDVFRETGFFKGLALFSWQHQPLLDHFVFHSAAMSVMAGDHSLVGVGQETDCATSTLLLASPKAVGFYNILPKARMADHLVFQCQCENIDELSKALHHALALEGFPHEDISWVGCANWCQQQSLPDAMKQVLPSAQCVPLEKDCQMGVVYQTNALVQQLETTETNFGLLLSFSPGSPVMATIFERI
ncbi:MAG: hypothetical protein JEZ06_08450 [Anaerolineaceae bacterium]|nr:hypothetical protein [Anaerolineaceae bacterium]